MECLAAAAGPGALAMGDDDDREYLWRAWDTGMGHDKRPEPDSVPGAPAPDSRTRRPQVQALSHITNRLAISQSEAVLELLTSSRAHAFLCIHQSRSGEEGLVVDTKEKRAGRVFPRAHASFSRTKTSRSGNGPIRRYPTTF